MSTRDDAGAAEASKRSFGTDNARELSVLSHSGAAFPQLVGGAGVRYRIAPE